MTMTVFEYLILFTIDFFSISFLRFLLSFGFDGEDYQTHKTAFDYIS